MGLLRSGRDCTGLCLLLLHGLCFSLVVFYVNMFQFWAWLSRQIGPGLLVRILPILVTLVVLLVIISRFVHRINQGRTINLVFLGLGIVCAVFALAIPDPHVPIKRIHVAEYIILAFLVRYTLSHRLSGASLTLFTFLVTLLLGVHDEMLQGFHPQRYYGWRDIVVNGTAGLSGALLGHGLLGLERPGRTRPAGRIRPGLAALYAPLPAAVAWQVFCLYRQQDESFTVLSWLPLVVVCAVIAVAAPATVLDSRRYHGFQAVFWLTLLLPLYPLLTRFTTLTFR